MGILRIFAWTIICSFTACNICTAQGEINIIVESNWGSTIVQKIADSSKLKGDNKAVLELDCLHLNRFVNGDSPLVALSIYPSANESKWIYGFKANEISKTSYMVGQAKVLVIVNKSNSIKHLNYEQLRRILGRNDHNPNWAAIGGGDGKVCVYSESKQSMTMSIVQATAMRKIIDSEECSFFPFGNYLQQCADGKDVIEKVMTDPSGIGFILFRDRLPTNVKVIAVNKRPVDAPVEPSDSPCIQIDYPLAQPLVLYLHPNQPAAAKHFCEFATDAEGASVAEKSGLITPWREAKYRGEKRLADMNTGKGTRIVTAGPTDFNALFSDMACGFVRAKTLIQPVFVVSEADMESVGLFLGNSSAGKDLLLLSDRPSESALRLYGPQWSKLDPTEYLLAGRATALVVNPASKLQSLTTDQVRSIFSGEVSDWNLFTSTAGKITCYGLAGSEPAAQVFFKEVLPIEKAGAIIAKKSTAEVLQAVSLDKNAIGFVDVSMIPATGQTARVLSIGPKIKAVLPTPENIKNAMYPLSQRLFLYVHPKASDTAKDFAKFLATCGGSEATPYNDTVQSVMDTYRKNGWTPLAEAALKATEQAQLQANKPIAPASTGQGGNKKTPGK